MEITAFALDQFKARTERDGGSLVILSTLMKNARRVPLVGRLSAMAEAREIAIIDLYDYITRQGVEPIDIKWAHGGHWNPTGHRLVGELLFEHLKQRAEIYDTAGISETSG